MQYTIRGIPESLDKAIRSRASEEGKSLNEVAIEALAEGIGLTSGDYTKRNLEGIAGTWAKDSAFEKAIAEQHRVDQDLWE